MLTTRSRRLFVPLLACVIPACGSGSDVIADGHLVFVRGLASDASGTYWVDEQVTGSDPTGVWHLTPGEEPRFLAEGAGNEIALDDTHVYWFEWAARAIQRVPKEGGEVESVVEGLGDWSSFALAGERILVIDTGSDRSGAQIIAAEVDGGGAEVIAPMVHATAQMSYPVVVGDRLYWQGGDRLLSMPVAGGEEETAWLGGVAAGSLSGDELGVYFATERGAVMWLTVEGEAVTLAIGEYQADHTTVVGDDVYFSAWRGDSSDEILLRRVPRPGGEVDTVAVDDVLLYDIAVPPGGPAYFSNGDYQLRAASL